MLLEPRRVAARAAAHRMSALLGETVGTTVGFRTRTETRVSARTRIEVVTEGVLTRRLQRDPTLENVGLVIFDEFHERSLVGDLGLALTLQSRALIRDDLRILVMSATLDSASVATLLGDADILTATGRVFPIETRHVAPRDSRAIEQTVAATVRRALDADAGDVLVFLPGAPEIHRVRGALDGTVGDATDVIPLHGSLSSDDQDRAIAAPDPHRRRVVLATAIAETSLTIPGVRVVIDAGFARRPRFSPRTGMTRLETVRVSRATADQRRGRAGRTAPGVCYRLWDEHEALVPAALPEIVEADLAPLALDLAAAGIGDPLELRWIDPPAPAAFAGARELLRELGLIHDDGRLTDDGERASGLPLHPRLAHMIVQAARAGVTREACDMAALLAERDIIRGDAHTGDADILVRLDIVAAARRRQGFAVPAGAVVQHQVVQRVVREAERLHHAVNRWTDARPQAVATMDAGSLLAMAYPDRVGFARRGNRGRFLLRGGIEVAVDSASPLAGEDFIVVADLDGKRPVSRAFLAAAIDRKTVESLFANQITTSRDVSWSERDGAVVAREQRRLGAIVLSERDVSADSADVSTALMRALIDRGVLDNVAVREEAARIAFARRLQPDRWPDTSADVLRATADDWLAPAFFGMRKLADADRIDWSEAMLSRLDYRQRTLLDELAPRHIAVPTGSRLRIDYSDPAAPTLAVRIQEVFGLRETPRVGGGAVPLTLQLLSPANRPVQVTRDLAGFWKNSYFDVRKDLRGRYPRHPWPDDPAQSVATRKARPR